MKKRIVLALLGVLIVAGLLAGIKALQIGKMIDQGKKFVPPAETVTTYQVQPLFMKGKKKLLFLKKLKEEKQLSKLKLCYLWDLMKIRILMMMVHLMY